MTDLLSAALFERDEMVLTAHRKDAHAPFGGQWVLPIAVVGEHETAEDAVRRHARETFGIDVGEERFVDTVYLEDPADQRRYVANIFRSEMGTAPMRFNAAGDYDDARWLGVGDIEQLWMPPALRAPVVRVLRGETIEPSVDWEREIEAEAAPLAERAEEVAPPPDNRAGWDAIAKAYQERRFGERFGERLMWSWRTSEDDVHLLDDVRGRRVLVLGCGGGQDVVALAKMGAVAVGMDQSTEQLAYARQYAARHDEPNASFVEGSVDDLSRLDDASFDSVIAAHMLNYVERIEDTVAETARVLKPGGAFCLSVRHPFDAMLADDAPYRVEASYWQVAQDWTWELEPGREVPFRQWFWPVERWFSMLTEAGFHVERLLEPREDRAIADDEMDDARAALVPFTLLLKARKR